MGRSIHRNWLIHRIFREVCAAYYTENWEKGFDLFFQETNSIERRCNAVQGTVNIPNLVDSPKTFFSHGSAFRIQNSADWHHCLLRRQLQQCWPWSWVSPALIISSRRLWQMAKTRFWSRKGISNHFFGESTDMFRSNIAAMELNASNVIIAKLHFWLNILPTTNVHLLLSEKATWTRSTRASQLFKSAELL